MEGVNFVELQGKIMWPSLKTVGKNDSKLFKGKVAVPLSDNPGRFQYVKISAWQSSAEALNEIPEDAFVKIHGHIEERSYEGQCRKCGQPEKKYWTEVAVDNFVIVE